MNMLENRTKGIVTLLESMWKVADNAYGGKDMRRSVYQFGNSQWEDVLSWHRLDVLEFVLAESVERYVRPRVGTDLVNSMVWCLGAVTERHNVQSFGNPEQIVESLLEGVGLGSEYHEYVTEFHIIGCIENERREIEIERLNIECSEWETHMQSLRDLKQALDPEPPCPACSRSHIPVERCGGCGHLLCSCLCDAV